MEVEAGQVLLDRYEVARQIGEGGMGKVFLGHHSRLRMPVALKVLTVGHIEGMEERFEREAMLMARVRHPNVVAILDYGFLDDGSPCIAMEYAEGEPLDELIKGKGALPVERALHLAQGVLAGLDAMHAQAVLHRDLKPSNVLVVSGEPEIAKLIDFGIALPTGPEETRLTRTGAIVGTPAYMAPEQLMSYPLDERTDVYAAALMLYEMLAGALPFPGRDLSAVARRLRDPIPRPVAPRRLPGISAHVTDCILTALSADSNQRPATARQFAAALSAGPERAAAGDGPAADSMGTDPTLMVDAVGDPNTWAEGVLDGPAATVADKIAPPLGQPTAPPVTPQPAPPPAAGGPAPAAEPRTARFLVAARVLPSRLKNPQDRRWLAQVAGTGARGYAFGGRFWFALQTAPGVVDEARLMARGIVEQLNKRYGKTTLVKWGLVGEDFSITTASLSGAAPMPRELSRLLDALAN